MKLRKLKTTIAFSFLITSDFCFAIDYHPRVFLNDYGRYEVHIELKQSKVMNQHDKSKIFIYAKNELFKFLKNEEKEIDSLELSHFTLFSEKNIKGKRYYIFQIDRSHIKKKFSLNLQPHCLKPVCD